jgi:hypothetical protein
LSISIGQEEEIAESKKQIPPKKSEAAAMMDELLSRVGLDAKREEKKAVLPDVDLPGENLSTEEMKAIDSIEGGEVGTVLPEIYKPSELVAAVVRLLLKKGIIVEGEFLEELKRH